jgi:hypothetical protein
MNIFGAFKAVTRVQARTLTKEDQILSSFMFYKAKVLTPAEIIAAKSAQAEQARISTRTHSAQLPKSLTIKLKARWVGGGHKQFEMNKSFITAPTTRSQSHKLILALTALGKRHLTISDVPSAYLQTRHESLTGKPA